MTQQASVINKLSAQKKAFALFLKPESDIPELILGEPCQLNAALKNKTQCFAFAPFSENEECPSYAILSEQSATGWANIQQLTNNLSSEEKASQSQVTGQQIAKQQYINLLNRTVETLKNNELQKVIISRPIVVDIKPECNVGELFIELSKTIKSAFRYIVSIPETGIWMGATPELLLDITNGVGKTTSLAGTLPANSSLQWGNKELDEQQMVTDYIQSALEKANADDITQGKRHSVLAGTVQHLQTNFSFKIDTDCSLINLVSQLHPTPAIGGLPRNNALHFIQNNELYNREYYAGFLGKIESNSNAQLFVNLRCMKLLSSQAVIYVGGGITAQSNPKKEWEETQLKALTLLQVIKQVNQQ